MHAHPERQMGMALKVHLHTNRRKGRINWKS